MTLFGFLSKTPKWSYPKVPYRYSRVNGCLWTHFQQYFDILCTFPTHNHTLIPWEASKQRILAISPLQCKRGKSKKNVLLDQFFKLHLSVPRCYFKQVEMLFGPLEGILSLRKHFWSLWEAQYQFQITPNYPFVRVFRLILVIFTLFSFQNHGLEMLT